MKDEGGKAVRDLRGRTKDFALRAIRVYQALPKGDGVAQVLGRQLLRSGTSVAAHYREACRAKSNPDFINKLEGALQELDETDLWLELLADAGTIKSSRVQPLRDEVNELIAIFVTMVKKVKGGR
ncbi:MAG TPA: four helix bundle protein [Chthoniobacterales bacterium]|jgi:four helix bundle protein|nr:four helix bundle protein [Chthoniobacterales bacterium]